MKRYTTRDFKYEADSPMARLQELENKVEDGELRKASDVAREIINEIEEAKKEIADRMVEFINEWKAYSESTVDYFGGKYEAMEVALRIVKSILKDKNAELKKKYESEGEG